jgi:hypothetical protein
VRANRGSEVDSAALLVTTPADNPVRLPVPPLIPVVGRAPGPAPVGSGGGGFFGFGHGGSGITLPR